MAVRLAERQAELRHAGWRVVSVEPRVVETLRDKAGMLRPLGETAKREIFWDQKWHQFTKIDQNIVWQNM